jgi:predicted neuraminidase
MNAPTNQEEALENTIDELKRADHLFYVSLKYTRTVDMIKHVIERLISTNEAAVEAMLYYAKGKKLITDVPTNAALRSELLKKTFPNDMYCQESLNMLALLLKLRRAKYTAREEYRRHVTMIAQLDGKEIVEVKIDTLGEQYKKTKEFVDYIHNLVQGRD